MTWFWIAWALFLCACVGAVALLAWEPIATVVAGSALFVVFLFLIILTISFYVDRAKCSAWEMQTGRESRFVTYNAVQWGCLARTDNGRWLPIEQLREFGEQAE